MPFTNTGGIRLAKLTEELHDLHLTGRRNMESTCQGWIR